MQATAAATTDSVVVQVLQFRYVDPMFKVEFAFRTCIGSIRMNCAVASGLRDWDFVDEGHVLSVCRGGIVMSALDVASGRPLVVKVVNLNVVRRSDLILHDGNPHLEREVVHEAAVNKHLIQVCGAGGTLETHEGRNNIALCVDITHDAELANLMFVQEKCDLGEVYSFVNGRLTGTVPGGRLSQPEMDSLQCDIRNGVKLLHAAGVAHMDLSVENLMLVTRNANDCVASCINGDDTLLPCVPIVKLIDFGQSFQCGVPPANRPFPSGVWTCGKAPYLPPEIAAQQYAAPGGPVVQIAPTKADIWMTGICLFVLAFFEHAYSTAQEGDRGFTMLVQGTLPCDRPGYNGPEYPLQFIDMLKSMLHIDPRQRPDT